MKGKGFRKKRGRFRNPHITRIKRGLFDFFLWQIGYYRDKNLLNEMPKTFSYPNKREAVAKYCPLVTWINHCSFIVEIDEVVVLTDPIWSDRCSPLSFAGPRRQHKAPLSLEQLPPIDFVLISHDHYDHLDKQTVLALHKSHPDVTWIVPLGLERWFKKLGIVRVIEFTWWQKRHFVRRHVEITITAVPSQHFSGRSLFDKNITLWAGYIIEFIRPKRKVKRLYFSGDTGYNEKDFKEIGKKFGRIDLSLLPIGTYVPHAFMDPVHIDPYKAVAIHQEVNSQLSVGMHWRTFCLSGEGMERPPYDLYLALKEKGIDSQTFRILDPGQTINW
jgi:N-acyl-phosphatidylethanolamine-hydrolysing phospholipase D